MVKATGKSKKFANLDAKTKNKTIINQSESIDPIKYIN